MSLLVTPRKATTAELVGQLKRYVCDHVVTTHLAASANRDQQVLGLIRARFPTAEATFGRVALLALARSGGRCYWCRTWPAAGADPSELPNPHHWPTWQLLGKPCPGCTNRLRQRYWPAAGARAGGRAGPLAGQPRGVPVTSTRRPPRAPAAPASPVAPWHRHARAADCRCDHDLPCLYRYSLELDWRERTAARARAGIHREERR